MDATQPAWCLTSVQGQPWSDSVLRGLGLEVGDAPAMTTLVDCVQSAAMLWADMTVWLAIIAVGTILVLASMMPVKEFLSRKSLVWLDGFVPSLPSVVVVHGTWGRRSPWFRGACLYDEIREKFAPEGVNVARFRWSGNNTMSARFRAIRGRRELFSEYGVRITGSEHVK